MRFAGLVDIPEELIKAQKDGELVIFAGAGVSIDPPSNLPNFNKLASIASVRFDFPLKNEFENNLELYFGLLEQDEKPIKEFIYEIYSNPDSLPNHIHGLLIDLFKSPDSIKIVTTNYDRHFNTVVEERKMDNINFFYAPALPPGNRFSGIAYIHGNVVKGAYELVFSQSGFGRAYITENWASKFLHDLFKTYTILFYGYRHNDTILKYLTKGLQDAKPMFAFANKDDEKHWRYYRITPIPYPIIEEKDKYKSVVLTLNNWSSHIHMSLIDHQDKMKSICDNPPPEMTETEVTDYIVDCIKDQIKIRSFSRFLNLNYLDRWLKWLNNQKLLDNLFKPCMNLSKAEIELSDWLARVIVQSENETFFELMVKNNHELNFNIWYSIAFYLAQEVKNNSDELFTAKCVSVLLDTIPSFKTYIRQLGMILMNCNYPENKNAALILFDFLTTPVRQFEESYSKYYDKDARYKADSRNKLKGNVYELRNSWEKIFKPNLDFYWVHLEPVLNKQLTIALISNVALGQANYNSDRDSWWRNAIEPHPQNHHPRDIDLLIDAARDLLEYVIQKDDKKGKMLCDMWFSTRVPILKRIALHGISINDKIIPEEKLEYIISNKLLYKSDCKHEVFKILEKSFANSNRQTQESFIKEVLRGPDDEQ